MALPFAITTQFTGIGYRKILDMCIGDEHQDTPMSANAAMWVGGTFRDFLLQIAIVLTNSYQWVLDVNKLDESSEKHPEAKAVLELFYALQHLNAVAFASLPSNLATVGVQQDMGGCCIGSYTPAAYQRADLPSDLHFARDDASTVEIMRIAAAKTADVFQTLQSKFQIQNLDFSEFGAALAHLVTALKVVLAWWKKLNLYELFVDADSNSNPSSFFATVGCRNGTALEFVEQCLQKLVVSEQFIRMIMTEPKVGILWINEVCADNQAFSVLVKGSLTQVAIRGQDVTRFTTGLVSDLVVKANDDLEDMRTKVSYRLLESLAPDLTKTEVALYCAAQNRATEILRAPGIGFSAEEQNVPFVPLHAYYRACKTAANITVGLADPLVAAKELRKIATPLAVELTRARDDFLVELAQQRHLVLEDFSRAVEFCIRHQLSTIPIFWSNLFAELSGSVLEPTWVASYRSAMFKALQSKAHAKYLYLTYADSRLAAHFSSTAEFASASNELEIQELCDAVVNSQKLNQSVDVYHALLMNSTKELMQRYAPLEKKPAAKVERKKQKQRNRPTQPRAARIAYDPTVNNIVAVRTPIQREMTTLKQWLQSDPSFNDDGFDQLVKDSFDVKVLSPKASGSTVSSNALPMVSIFDLYIDPALQEWGSPSLTVFDRNLALRADRAALSAVTWRTCLQNNDTFKKILQGLRNMRQTSIAACAFVAYNLFEAAQLATAVSPTGEAGSHGNCANEKRRLYGVFYYCWRQVKMSYFTANQAWSPFQLGGLLQSFHSAFAEGGMRDSMIFSTVTNVVAAFAPPGTLKWILDQAQSDYASKAYNAVSVMVAEHSEQLKWLEEVIEKYLPWAMPSKDASKPTAADTLIQTVRGVAQEQVPLAVIPPNPMPLPAYGGLDKKYPIKAPNAKAFCTIGATNYDCVSSDPYKSFNGTLPAGGKTSNLTNMPNRHVLFPDGVVKELKPHANGTITFETEEVFTSIEELNQTRAGAPVDQSQSVWFNKETNEWTMVKKPANAAEANTLHQKATALALPWAYSILIGMLTTVAKLSIDLYLMRSELLARDDFQLEPGIAELLDEALQNPGSKEIFYIQGANPFSIVDISWANTGKTTILSLLSIITSAAGNVLTKELGLSFLNDGSVGVTGKNLLQRVITDGVGVSLWRGNRPFLKYPLFAVMLLYACFTGVFIR